MDYDFLELAPIVAQLIEKYNAKKGTAPDKKQTEEFMQAITFCIDEVIANGDACEVAAENMSAAQSYVDGLKLVTEKLKNSASLYNKEMADFNDYGNPNLRNFFTGELRTFFEKYDPIFKPQDSVVNFSYPMLVNLGDCRGIDLVSEMLRFLTEEQKFLRSLPATYVETALKAYNPDAASIKENVMGIVARDIAIHALCAKPINKPELLEADYRKAKLMVKQDGPKKCTDNALMVLNLLIKKCFGEETDFTEYIMPAIEKTMADLAG